MTHEPAPSRVPTGANFGTFKGVYTPSILTILGVVMYLRLGWVVGNTGMFGALVVVTLASAVTFLTGLSIAATATNMRIGIGGAYFMISRSLGLEAGAAIGLPLFFAQALGVSFYVVGFAESLNGVFPILPVTLIGVITLMGLAGLAYTSADLALRAQYFILAAITASLLSFFFGGPPDVGFEPVASVPEIEPFWVVFSVFFPAVTGIEAGIAMSGDLKEPGRALPRGTIAAVVTGYVVYVGIAVALGSWVPKEVLLTDSLVMEKVAAIGPLIMVGIWGATLSSALGALLGAPRTLQALGRDRVVPSVLATGHGPNNEPRIATGVAFVVALAGVLAGSLNAIAPVLSMFFLTSYGFLNLSAGLEGLIGSPSWRPEFRTPWWLSLTGAALCFSTMFMIDSGATFAAAAVSGLVFYLMGRRRLRAYWGSIEHGLLMLLARFAVYRLAEVEADERTWRPNILVLSGPPKSRWYLIEFADALSHGAGFLTVAAVVPERELKAGRVQELEAAMASYLGRQHIPALVEVHLADDVMTGAASLMQATGLGPVFPNTVLMGVSEDGGRLDGFAHLIQLAWQLRRNLIIVREGTRQGPRGKTPRILVWWGGQLQNAGLMVALGYLLLNSAEWHGAELHLRTVVATADDVESATRALAAFIDRGRLRAQCEVFIQGDAEVFDVIREASHEFDQVFLGLRPPQPGQPLASYLEYYEGLMERTHGLPPAAYVLAAEEIDFQRIWE